MFAPNKYCDGCIVIINLFSAHWLVQCVLVARLTVRNLGAAIFLITQGQPWKKPAVHARNDSFFALGVAARMTAKAVQEGVRALGSNFTRTLDFISSIKIVSKDNA